MLLKTIVFIFIYYSFVLFYLLFFVSYFVFVLNLSHEPYFSKCYFYYILVKYNTDGVIFLSFFGL